MALQLKSSRHRKAGSRRAGWRTGGALALILALTALPLCSSGAAAAGNGHGQGRESAALRILRGTLLAAVRTSGARNAIHTLGNSLALLDARYRIENGTAGGPGAKPTTKPRPKPALSEAVVSDPSKLAPASAGSNGTAVPHAPSVGGGEIFAHTRAGGESSAILLSGVALAPPDAPEAVKNVINNANMIVGRPYVWGGGHASFYSYGYDCSGSVSFALFGGGLIPEPLTSGSLESWGAPGPGKWITVYANADHAFAEIAGLRWDTVGDAQGTGPRWHLASTDTAGFVARHPPGL